MATPRKNPTPRKDPTPSQAEAIEPQEVKHKNFAEALEGHVAPLIGQPLTPLSAFGLIAIADRLRKELPGE